MLQLLAVYHPGLSRLLETAPLSARDWLAIGVFAVLPALVGQLAHASRRAGNQAGFAG